MTGAPHLSVIIPCHRSGEALREQVQALVDQVDAPRREILLCDNGGNEWLAAWAESLTGLPEDVELRVVNALALPGAAYARNCGIAEARAELLAFCDDDDLVHPLWCARAVQALQRHHVVSGGIVTRDEAELEGMSVTERSRLLILETVDSPARPIGRGSMGPALMAGNFAAHRNVLLEVGAFDAALVRGAEDNDLGYRLAAAGVEIVDLGGMSILYRRASHQRDRLRTLSRAGHALMQAASARNAWDEVRELRTSPVRELARSAASLGAMMVGARTRDITGASERLAVAWGLSRGWLRYRVTGRPHPSMIGAGLDECARTEPWPQRADGEAQ